MESTTVFAVVTVIYITGLFFIAYRVMTLEEAVSDLTSENESMKQDNVSRALLLKQIMDHTESAYEDAKAYNKELRERLTDKEQALGSAPSEAFQEGQRAWNLFNNEGKQVKNPYPKFKEDYAEWRRGFNVGISDVNVD